GMFDFLPAILHEYALRAFTPQNCQVHYSNGSDGESAFSLTITLLNDHAMLIKHGYFEGHGTELELVNARVSEIYYLILNIIKYLPQD
ncbi:hypothetical protein, partial [Salmonella enterica]|uniref:hypothetical protein n=1 Tax=Salmonella enterica TaxID=28901 RepID=UPI003297FDC1